MQKKIFTILLFLSKHQKKSRVRSHESECILVNNALSRTPKLEV